MAGLKIHYDGWVKLPAALLRAPVALPPALRAPGRRTAVKPTT